MTTRTARSWIVLAASLAVIAAVAAPSGWAEAGALAVCGASVLSLARLDGLRKRARDRARR